MMKRHCLIFLVAGALSAMASPLAANPYFPLSVGNWWHFDGIQVDSLGATMPGTEYDSWTHITGLMVIDDETYHVVVDSNDQSGYLQMEISYMRDVGDTLKNLMPFMSDSGLTEVNMAILPRPEGFTWQVAALDTTYEEMGITIHFEAQWEGEVADYSTLTVPAGTFAGTCHIIYQLHIEMEMSMPETLLAFDRTMEVWVAPGVGPVRFFELPMSGPGDPEPGSLEELAEHDLPVAPGYTWTAPAAYSLHPAAPNPFNAQTRLAFDLPAPARPLLEIFDAQGSSVARMDLGSLPAGDHAWIWDASGLPSGVYLARLQTESWSASQALILLK